MGTIVKEPSDFKKQIRLLKKKLFNTECDLYAAQNKIRELRKIIDNHPKDLEDMHQVFENSYEARIIIKDKTIETLQEHVSLLKGEPVRCKPERPEYLKIA